MSFLSISKGGFSTVRKSIYSDLMLLQSKILVAICGNGVICQNGTKLRTFFTADCADDADLQRSDIREIRDIRGFSSENELKLAPF